MNNRLFIKWKWIITIVDNTEINTKVRFTGMLCVILKSENQDL